MRILGVGTEIVECLRIAQMVERHGELFLQRIFTPDEIQYCSSRKMTTQFYASRWAGKKAVLTALGTSWTREISWRDIELRGEPADRPYVVLSGEVADLAGRMGIEQMLISMAHCRTHAVGYALAVTASEV